MDHPNYICCICIELYILFTAQKLRNDFEIIFNWLTKQIGSINLLCNLHIYFAIYLAVWKYR